jgi:proline iminopeptidase
MYKHKYIKYKTKYLYGGNSDKDMSYPITEPFDKGKLKVDNIHTLYYEQNGNPTGKPIVLLHGGPGGSISKKYSSLFDKSIYRVITFDQRGCGNSTPYATLENNTTDYLINDIEKIREHLGIEKWYICGGSWGSTLGLLYSIKYPFRVLGINISGVCLFRQMDIDWLYRRGGVSNIHPEEFDDFESILSNDEKKDTIKSYFARLTSQDKNIQMEACHHWAKLELRLMSPYDPKQFDAELRNLENILPCAIYECYYSLHKAFLPTDNYILDNINRIENIPIIITQARFDIICPVDSAYQIKKKLPKTDLRILPIGGHSARDIATKNFQIKALNDLHLLASVSSL